MSAHTPGPWSLFEFNDGWYINQVGGPGFVETVYRMDHRADECAANARLMAAAPELLAALQLVERNSTRADWPADIYDAMQNAIAKAQP